MAEVAIIGGGLSGLAVAYELNRKGRSLPGGPPRITLFESGDRVGGNSQTRVLDFGGANEYRFCDLGVNDFNARTYQNVVRVLDAVGVGYSLLEDSACFFEYPAPSNYDPFKPGNDFTIGPNPYVPMTAAMQAEYARFQTDATTAYSQLGLAKSFDYSILDYLNGRIVIGGQPPSKPYSDAFIKRCILPRVGAMYFCDDANPASSMPFGSVMQYYIIQEGMGTPFGPLRMYFHRGAQTWIERLAAATDANVLTGDAVTAVNRQSEGLAWAVDTASGGGRTFDYVVFALPPKRMYDIRTNSAQIDAVTTLFRDNFRFAPAEITAHTYAGLLPKDQNFWRTYNVMIRDTAQPWPYAMTYVENRHQNDGLNAAYNRFGLPQFMISINPPEPIPEPYVLMDAFPTSQNTLLPIRTTLDHLILDRPAYDAQVTLTASQGVDELYYVGNWTCLSGLHEQCWHQAMLVADSMLSTMSAAGSGLPGKAFGEFPDIASLALR